MTSVNFSCLVLNTDGVTAQHVGHFRKLDREKLEILYFRLVFSPKKYLQCNMLFLLQPQSFFSLLCIFYCSIALIELITLHCHKLRNIHSSKVKHTKKVIIKTASFFQVQFVLVILLVKALVTFRKSGDANEHEDKKNVVK